MSSKIKVEDATTQKKHYKFAHLDDVFNDCLECDKNERLLKKIEVCGGLQNVNDNSGDFIQCILWLDNCDDILEQLQEIIDEQEAIENNELYKEQQAIINHLIVFMVENDLEFIFI